MTRTVPAFCAAVAMMLSPAANAGPDEPTERELALLFEPDRTDQIALAPDAAHVAYTVREHNVLVLVLMSLRPPYRHVQIRLGRDAFLENGIQRVLVPFFRWSDPQHLVYAVFPPRLTMDDEPAVYTVDADGRDPRALVTADALRVAMKSMTIVPVRDATASGFRARGLVPSRPLRVIGFVHDRPGILAVEAGAIGPVPREVYEINVETGTRRLSSTVAAAGRVLYDRNGEPAIIKTPRRATTIDGKQRFQYRTGGRWVDLDEYLPTDSGLQFEHSDTNYYGPRSIPLAFGADPNVLYFASRVGRETFGIYALNLGTRQQTGFAVVESDHDLAAPSELFSESRLVFDRQYNLAGVRLGRTAGSTHWLDAELAQMQILVERQYSNRNVDVLEWSDDRRCALVLVSGPGDAGRYVLVQTNLTRLTEIVRRAPARPEPAALAKGFGLPRSDGSPLSGVVTLPRRVRTYPPPLVVLCPDVPGSGSLSRQRGAFNPHAQAFAAMGFAVLEVNYRGLAGFGARHQEVGRTSLDRAPLEDIRAAITALRERYHFDATRVALMGEGFGGYLAVRGLELFPGEFKCAVAMDAPLDLDRWLAETGGPPRAPSFTAAGLSGIGPGLVPAGIALRREFFGRQPQLGQLSALRAMDAIRAPVLLLQDTNGSGLSPEPGRQLRNGLRGRGIAADFVELSRDYVAGAPEEVARVTLRVGEFLNSAVYDYGVRIGPLKEVE